MISRAAVLALVPLALGTPLTPQARRGGEYAPERRRQEAARPDPQAQASVPAPEPSCRASLRGSDLTTFWGLPNGYRLEARWALTFVSPPDGAEPGSVATDLKLKTLTERDSVTGRKSRVELEQQWRLGIIGRNALDAVDQLVAVWCRSLGTTARGSRYDRVVLARPGRRT